MNWRVKLQMILELTIIISWIFSFRFDGGVTQYTFELGAPMKRTRKRYFDFVKSKIKRNRLLQRQKLYILWKQMLSFYSSQRFTIFVHNAMTKLRNSFFLLCYFSLLHCESEKFCLTDWHNVFCCCCFFTSFSFVHSPNVCRNSFVGLLVDPWNRHHTIARIPLHVHTNTNESTTDISMCMHSANSYTSNSRRQETRLALGIGTQATRAKYMLRLNVCITRIQHLSRCLSIYAINATPTNVHTKYNLCMLQNKTKQNNLYFSMKIYFLKKMFLFSVKLLFMNAISASR